MTSTNVSLPSAGSQTRHTEELMTLLLVCLHSISKPILYMMVHGMQQKSHSPPPGQGHSRQPVFGAEGFPIDVVELLAIDGSTGFTSSLGSAKAVMMDRGNSLVGGNPLDYSRQDWLPVRKVELGTYDV